MSVDQLIAEFKALSAAERQKVARAIFSDGGSWLVEGPDVLKGPVQESEGKVSFSERWVGTFTLPEADPGDAKLTYLLDRFSA
jgi:hypothetical protein